MRTEQVEIYSDAANNAVMRHPGRKFPGVLFQGDSLYTLCREADALCVKARDVLDTETFGDLNNLRNALWTRLNHYKQVLGEHGISLPFNEMP